MVGFGAPDDSDPAVESPQDARRRQLEARVYGGEAPTPAEVAELRGLMAAPRGREASTAEGSGAAQGAAPRHRSESSLAQRPARERDDRDIDDPAAAAAPDHSPPREPGTRERPARAWLAGGVVAIVLAALIGAGTTTSILGSRSGVQPAETTSTAQAGGNDTGATPVAIGASSPATGLGPAGEAEALSAQYFDQPQSAGDRPPVSLPGILPSSTRRVFSDWGQQPGEPSVWVARGRDKSFCLIVSIDSSHAGSSCTPDDQAAAAGVRVAVVTPKGGTIAATWNLAEGLLELSPFPAGANVISSGAFPPTP